MQAYLNNYIEQEYQKILKLKPAITNNNVEDVIPYYIFSTLNLDTDGSTLLSIASHNGECRLCTKGNISTIVAAPKVGKSTFALGCIVAPLIAQRTIFPENDQKFVANIEESVKVLVVDTEQGNEDINLKLESLWKITDGLGSDSVEVLSFRGAGPSTIKLGLEGYLEGHSSNLDYILVDGIADLVTDVNKADEASSLITDLMHWSVIYDVHIMTILHTTKTGDRGTGHLGSALEKKSETVITLTVNDILGVNVDPTFTRGMGFDPFAFKFENGLPRIIDDVIVRSKSKSKTGSFSPDQVGKQEFVRMLQNNFETDKWYGTSDFSAKLQIMLTNKGLPSGRDKVTQVKVWLQERGLIEDNGKGRSRHMEYKISIRKEDDST